MDQASAAKEQAPTPCFARLLGSADGNLNVNDIFQCNSLPGFSFILLFNSKNCLFSVALVIPISSSSCSAGNGVECAVTFNISRRPHMGGFLPRAQQT